MKGRLISIFCLCFCFLFLGASVVSADSITLNLTQSNSLPDGSLYGTVLIDRTLTATGASLTFTVTANTAVLTGGSVGIKDFYFSLNDDFSQPLFSSTNAVLSLKSGGNVSEFGVFDNGISASKEKDKVNPMVFTLTLTGENAQTLPIIGGIFTPSTNDYSFASHIFNFDGIDGQTSAFFADGASPVPEPASLFLLGSGLFGLAGVYRKKIRR